jgi:hypothetical protein
MVIAKTLARSCWFRMRREIAITLAARAPNSMCIRPLLVLEERAKEQRNLPMMITLGARGKRAGRAQDVAPMLKKFRLAVERLV